MPLSVATLNVAGLPSSLPPLRHRAPVFCRYFEDAGYDVVNLQEVWTHGQLRAIRPHLPSYPHVSWRRGIGGHPCGGLVTFTRRPVDQSRYTSFRGAPAGGSLGFRARQWLNARLQGVLTTTLAEVPVAIGNTHLTANKDGDWSTGNRHYPMQLAQLDRLHAVMNETDAELTVLCGDFNVASSGPLYDNIRQDYRDPFAEADPWTFHVALLHPNWRPHRIDYLLVRGDEDRYPVRSYGVIFDEPVPGFEQAGPLDAARPPAEPVGLVSDHVGLTAEIELN